MLGDFRQRDEWLEVQPIVGHRYTAEAADISDVDQTRRSYDALLHQIEEVNAACLQHSTVVEFGEGLIDCRAIYKREAIHALSSEPTLPSASSTLAGVIGILLIRTPVAL